MKNKTIHNKKINKDINKKKTKRSTNTSFALIRTHIKRYLACNIYTAALDILVAPIRFVEDVNKRHFPGIERQWELEGEYQSAQRRLFFPK